MPIYDYRCEANGRVLEVSDRIGELLNTWGELCEQAGIEAADTSPDASVHKLAPGDNVVSRSALINPEPVCGNGTCCPCAVCGLD